AGGMGSTVRRLLECRPADCGSIHRQRGGQMATAQRIGAAIAARLRRRRAGTFQRANGALPDARRGGEYSNRLSEHARAVLSLSAPAGAAFVAETAGSDDPKKLIAPSQSDFEPG